MQEPQTSSTNQAAVSGQNSAEEGVPGEEESKDEEYLGEMEEDEDEYSAAAGEEKLNKTGPAQINTDLQSQCQYSRKEKSLGELCRRFLGLYGSEARTMLYLDQCTRELAVERRRIYDIINILESF